MGCALLSGKAPSSLCRTQTPGRLSRWIWRVSRRASISPRPRVPRRGLRSRRETGIGPVGVGGDGSSPRLRDGFARSRRSVPAITVNWFLPPPRDQTLRVETHDVRSRKPHRDVPGRSAGAHSHAVRRSNREPAAVPLGTRFGSAKSDGKSLRYSATDRPRVG